jgi:2-polyprenyl-3-methyl-5-hydroxy-6-metoxy-1,4-benzoquinol methylase
LPFAIPSDRGEWVRCRVCGSDSASQTYEDVKAMYSDRDEYNKKIGFTDLDIFRKDCRWNCEWINDNALLRCGKKILDIGTWHGSAMDVMRELTWDTEGFDVVPVPVENHPVTVKPFFHRWWWPYQFSAVIAIEVFEHVLGPEMFLHEVHGVLVPGGLFHFTTPFPTETYENAPYQKEHLFLASQKRMKELLDQAMFDLIGERTVGVRHCYLCRARG